MFPGFRGRSSGECREKRKAFFLNFRTFHFLQYHHQIGGIGSEQEKSLYSSCFFTDEKRQYTDEGDQQAGGKVKGDGGRCHREGVPEAREQRGRIRVRSRMLAPMILPAERSCSFFRIAARVVTSSGMDVPTATTVMPMIRSGIPSS